MRNLMMAASSALAVFVMSGVLAAAAPAPEREPALIAQAISTTRVLNIYDTGEVAKITPEGFAPIPGGNGGWVNVPGGGRLVSAYVSESELDQLFALAISPYAQPQLPTVSVTWESGGKTIEVLVPILGTSDGQIRKARELSDKIVAEWQETYPEDDESTPAAEGTRPKAPASRR